MAFARMFSAPALGDMTDRLTRVLHVWQGTTAPGKRTFSVEIIQDFPICDKPFLDTNERFVIIYLVIWLVGHDVELCLTG